MSLGANVINPRISGAAAISLHLWIYADTYDAVQGNDLFYTVINSVSAAGPSISIDSTGANNVLRVGGRSVTGDAFQVRNATSDLVTGQWHSVGGVLNFTGDTLTPYVNGVAENSGAATFANTTYTPGTPTGADKLGSAAGPGAGPAATNRQFDGRLAECALWNVDIGAAGFAALATRTSPLWVRPANLRLYMSLYGAASPERCRVNSGISGTITGTVAAADHPPVAGPPVVRLSGWQGALARHAVPHAWGQYRARRVA